MNRAHACLSLSRSDQSGWVSGVGCDGVRRGEEGGRGARCDGGRWGEEGGRGAPSPARRGDVPPPPPPPPPLRDTADASPVASDGEESYMYVHGEERRKDQKSHTHVHYNYSNLMYDIYQCYMYAQLHNEELEV